MAAPLSVATKATNGKFMMNRSLSDDPDEVLRLQGVSWFKRRAVFLFTLTLRIKHTTDEASVEHVDMDQIISGIPGMRENAVLDGCEREQDHFIFGLVTSRSRRIPVEEIPDEPSKKGWAQDTVDDGVLLIECWSTPGKNSRTWKTVQIWGFAMVNGQRRYVTQTIFTSSEKQDGPIRVRVVYDYVGAL